MTYTNTWDETAPAGSQPINLGDNVIRAFKTDIRERIADEHNFNATGTTVITHKAGRCSVIFYGTTSEINALSSPPQYAMAYDTTLEVFKQYTGSAWTQRDATHTHTGYSTGRGGYTKLYITRASVSTLTINYQSCVLTTVGGADFCSTAPGILTANIGNDGANGLDTGGATEANSTWYYVYVIYNPTTTTTASLLSTHTSSPTLPSGYTYFARVGSMYNDSGGDFRYISKYNETAYYTTPIAALSNGTASTVTAVDLSATVPATASAVIVNVVRQYKASGSDYVKVTNNNNDDGLASPIIVAGASGAIAGVNSNQGQLMITTLQTIYYLLSGTVSGTDYAHIYVVGWIEAIA